MKSEVVKAASVALGFELVRALREGEGSMPEADAPLNAASRRVVEAMIEVHGEAWFVAVNPDRETRRRVWKCDGEITNFIASAVVPRYDEKLEKMIRDRVDGTYTGTRSDSKLVDAILERVRALGGEILVWS